jgi:hypothetical protein
VGRDGARLWRHPRHRLLGYAEGFAAAGIDIVVFGYRGFAVSEGAPRQLVSSRRQRQDYLAASAATRRLPGAEAAYRSLAGPTWRNERGEQSELLATLASDWAVRAMTAYVEQLERVGEVPAYDEDTRQKLLDGTFVDMTS